jgi:uncharacterized protein YggE
MTAGSRTVALSLFTTAALAVAYLLGAAGPDDARASVPTTGGEASLGTITMTGTGEVVAVPDQIVFTVAVAREADDVATAMDDASATMARVLDALGRSGVERKDTESTGLSVDPEYYYAANLPPQLTGYRVRQSMSVLVRDLRDGGDSIAAAVSAGGNAVRVSGISLRVGDREALMARARDAAVEDAAAKAEQYAEATGQPLGDVLTVREGRLPGRTRPDRDVVRGYGAADMEALKAVPIRAGQTDVGVKVTVVWALDGSA